MITIYIDELVNFLTAGLILAVLCWWFIVTVTLIDDNERLKSDVNSTHAKLNRLESITVNNGQMINDVVHRLEKMQREASEVNRRKEDECDATR